MIYKNMGIELNSCHNFTSVSIYNSLVSLSLSLFLSLSLSHAILFFLLNYLHLILILNVVLCVKIIPFSLSSSPFLSHFLSLPLSLLSLSLSLLMIFACQKLTQRKWALDKTLKNKIICFYGWKSIGSLNDNWLFLTLFLFPPKRRGEKKENEVAKRV